MKFNRSHLVIFCIAILISIPIGFFIATQINVEQLSNFFKGKKSILSPFVDDIIKKKDLQSLSNI